MVAFGTIVRFQARQVDIGRPGWPAAEGIIAEWRDGNQKFTLSTSIAEVSAFRDWLRSLHLVGDPY
jgi:hypothetical protein